MRSNEMTLSERWKEYNTNVNKHVKLAEDLIAQELKLESEHVNTATKPHIAQAITMLINELLDILKVVNDYATETQEQLLPNFFQVKDMYQEIVNSRAYVLINIVELNRRQASTYYQAILLTTSQFQKKECIKISYEAILFAYNMQKKHAFQFPNKDYSYLETEMNLIKKVYNELHGSPTLPKNKIEKILVEARKIKDADQLFNKFQEAIDLEIKAKNLNQQFIIAFDQVDHYIAAYSLQEKNRSNKGIAPIDAEIKHVKKVAEATIFAAELGFENHSLIDDHYKYKYPILCNRLYHSTKSILTLLDNNKKLFSKDMNKRSAVLDDAKRYYEYFQKYKKYDISYYKYENIGEPLKEHLNKLEAEKKKQDELDLKIKEEKEKLEQCKQEYEEKLDSLYKECEALDANYKKNNYRMKIIKQKPTCNDHHVSTSSEEEIKVKEKSNNNPSPVNYDLNIEEDIKSLKDAENSNNYPQQIFMNAKIADHYRIDAIHASKKNHIDETINHLTLAKKHLLCAIQTIHRINKNQLNVELNNISQIDIWTKNVLEDTKLFLEDILAHQRRLLATYEENRKNAMNHIITKYGKEAWFKGRTLDECSESAKRLDATKKRVRLLSGIQNDILKYQQSTNEKEASVNANPTFFKQQVQINQTNVTYSKKSKSRKM